jgi:thioredoxin 1
MSKDRSRLVIITILVVITLVVLLRKKPDTQYQVQHQTRETTRVIIKTETISEKVTEVESGPQSDNLSTQPQENKLPSQEDNNVTETKIAPPKNPLTLALTNGKPTVLDFGADYCQPCKMMKPIFEELEKEYQSKANVILLDINEYRDLTNEYKVRLIPTQIFFDKDGKPYWRHEGFLSKQEIVKKLIELGIE